MHRGIGQALLLGRKMAAPGAQPQILVQYLVLRKDLSQAPFSWPAGALVAQACHAATAALHTHRDHPHTVAYLQELGRMRKVVLEAPDETTLKELAETLRQKSIDHMLWQEQPENVATCIALRPYPKEEEGVKMESNNLALNTLYLALRTKFTKNPYSSKEQNCAASP